MNLTEHHQLECVCVRTILFRAGNPEIYVRRENVLNAEELSPTCNNRAQNILINEVGKTNEIKKEGKLKMRSEFLTCDLDH